MIEMSHPIFIDWRESKRTCIHLIEGGHITFPELSARGKRANNNNNIERNT
jgi:hypothetical protein